MGWENSQRRRTLATTTAATARATAPPNTASALATSAMRRGTRGGSDVWVATVSFMRAADQMREHAIVSEVVHQNPPPPKWGRLAELRLFGGSEGVKPLEYRDRGPEGRHYI